MIRPLLILALCSLAWPAGAQSYRPEDDLRVPSKLLSWGFMDNGSKPPVSVVLDINQGGKICGPARMYAVSDGVIFEVGSLPSGQCVDDSAFKTGAETTLNDALTACDRLDRYMTSIGTAIELQSKCSRIRAMRDNAQGKRDLDTIDRFLEGKQ